MNNGALDRIIQTFLYSIDLYLQDMTGLQREKFKKEIDKHFKDKWDIQINEN